MIGVAEVGLVVGVPVLRSVLGWFENAAKDGVFEDFEIKELVATVLRGVGLGTGILLGFPDVSGVVAAGSVMVAEYAMHFYKKARG